MAALVREEDLHPTALEQGVSILLHARKLETDPNSTVMLTLGPAEAVAAAVVVVLPSVSTLLPVCKLAVVLSESCAAILSLLYEVYAMPAGSSQGRELEQTYYRLVRRC